MTGALLSFSVSALAIRALGKQLTTFEILSIRSGAGLFVLLALVAVRPALRRELAPRYMGFHLARNTTHFVGQFSWALAVTLLPFATVFALEFTTPAWVALLAALDPRRAHDQEPRRQRRAGLPRRAGDRAAGACELPADGAAGAVRRLHLCDLADRHQATDQPRQHLRHHLLDEPDATADGAGLARRASRRPAVRRCSCSASAPTCCCPTLALGVVGLTSHYCLTQAFRSGDATVVVPLDFLRIPLIALVGWMFYGEALDGFVFAGAGLIICGVLWNLFAESRRPGSPVAASTEKAQSAEP